MMDLHEIAVRLNGIVNGRWINVRGPGHGPRDRSLGVRFDRAACDGFYIHSLAGDDEAECREYVRLSVAEVRRRALRDLLSGYGKARGLFHPRFRRFCCPKQPSTHV